METASGLAVCDCELCKLHHAWALWRIGVVDRARWTAEAKHARQRSEGHRLGLGDLVLVEPLPEWYAAVDQLDPGHVIWGFPASGLDPRTIPGCAQRTGGDLLDALIELLPM